MQTQIVVLAANGEQAGIDGAATVFNYDSNKRLASIDATDAGKQTWRQTFSYNSDGTLASCSAWVKQ